MARGMRGMGQMGGVGGLSRTYGLHRHFERGGPEGPRPRITRGALGRVATYFRPYLARWILVVICIACTSGLQVLPPFCVRSILDRAIPESDFRLLALLSGAMVGLTLVTGLIGVLQESLVTVAGQGIMYDLRNQLYRHLQRMSLRFYTTTRSGEIVARINNDVGAVQGVTTHTLVAVISNIATLTATSIAIFSMNWKLSLAAITVVPLFYLPSRLVGRVRHRLAMESQESQASLLGFLNERLHIGGAILSSIFGQKTADAREFAAHSARVRDLSVRQAVVGRWLRMVLGTFSAVGPALIYFYGGYQVIQEELTLGMLIAFAALLGLLYRPLVQLASVYVDLYAALAVFDRIFEYLDMEPQVRDPETPATELPYARGHVAVEGVGFRYPRPPAVVQAVAPAAPNGGGVFALEDVSLEILPGQRVALVGPSGAGKTTLTYLVPRFYDPDTGRITLDGVDLRTLRQEDLRRHIGMVTQETFLFHASVRENLLYARPEATDAEMQEACRAANIHELIAGLPDGYDTVVGERGFRLSGGEKQRLSIARALLKDPTILILDEATSNLDATSEHLIQQALEKLLHGRTSLIIAHRLSTILSSDRIVVLDKGRVVEAGTHTELLRHNGLYAELFEKQFGEVLNSEGPRPDGHR
jgi:ATP-binding cassette subfamily B protein